LLVAMEVGNRQWKLGFTHRPHKIGRVTIEVRDRPALQEQIGQAKSRLGLPEDAPVLSCCYEANPDGIWLHRYLVSRGIDNKVLEPSSIKVDRRRWRVNTVSKTWLYVSCSEFRSKRPVMSSLLTFRFSDCRSAVGRSRSSD